jgi:hypothetical protein
MIVPVVHSCGKVLAWYDTATGCIRDEQLPRNMKIFGAMLFCKKCRVDYKFDGLRHKKKFQSTAKKPVDFC